MIMAVAIITNGNQILTLTQLIFLIIFVFGWGGGIRTPMPREEQIYSLPSQPIAQLPNILLTLDAQWIHRVIFSNELNQ